MNVFASAGLVLAAKLLSLTAEPARLATALEKKCKEKFDSWPSRPSA